MIFFPLSTCIFWEGRRLGPLEQSFNCFGNGPRGHVAFEQFIRQSLSLPNQAVVVFSNSMTPNWKKQECSDPKPVRLSDEDKGLLDAVHADPMKVVTEINSQLGPHKTEFSAMNDLFEYYEVAGIQTWFHAFYEEYKCHGPYIADWGCCSAKWHPSKLGHQLRAAHYSYWWLVIFKAALVELQGVSQTANLDDHFKNVYNKVNIEHKYVPKDALYNSTYSNTLTCYTTVEPIYDRDFDLLKLILPPKTTTVDGVAREPFKREIYEYFRDRQILIRARAQGSLDYKYMLYGNVSTFPLSLKLEIKHEGTVHVCEPPGNRVSYPIGFASFFKDGNAKAYLTQDVKDYGSFDFDISRAKEVPIIDLNAGPQNNCAEIVDIPLGNHVLTLVPCTEKNIIFSYIILP